MTQRRIADIMAKSGSCNDGAHIRDLCIAQIVIFFKKDPGSSSERTADRAGFQTVGQPGTDIILLHQRENLSFILKSAEGS